VIIGNLDPFALPPLARLRCLVRVVNQGIAGYLEPVQFIFELVEGVVADLVAGTHRVLRRS